MGLRKRLLAFLIVLVSLFSTIISAYAHIPCVCDNPPDQCTCFIQLGDKGYAVERIIARLKKIGYLGKSVKKTEFTPEVKQAVLQFQRDYNLECTGWMDDETLNALLSDVLPDEKVKYPKSHWDGIYYVPTDGGKRYHADPTCCDMYNPRMISGVNAECLGIHFCGLEYKEKEPSTTFTYSSLGLTPRELPASYYEEVNEASAVPQRSLPSEDVESVYVGNKNSHVFHRSTCSSASSMSEKNKVAFSSREEAIEKGYKPCGKCNP